MTEYKLMLFDKYIVRRDSVGADDGEILYEYYELEKEDYDLLTSGLFDTNKYNYMVYCINISGTNILRDFKVDESDWLEMKVGDWKFFFQGNPDKPELKVISHFNKSGYVEDEYVFLTLGEYTNTFR